jgi:hypothetical protein
MPKAKRRNGLTSTETVRDPVSLSGQLKIPRHPEKPSDEGSRCLEGDPSLHFRMTTFLVHSQTTSQPPSAVLAPVKQCRFALDDVLVRGSLRLALPCRPAGRMIGSARKRVGALGDA